MVEGPRCTVAPGRSRLGYSRSDAQPQAGGMWSGMLLWAALYNSRTHAGRYTLKGDSGIRITTLISYMYPHIAVHVDNIAS